MKTTNLKLCILTGAMLLTVFACKKKEETPEPVAEEVPPPCFSTNYNGTYIGSGFTMSSGYTTGTLTVSRTNCTTASINLTTNTSSIIHEQASQLALNSNGGYDGKLNNGNNISLTLGSNLQVNAVGSFTFTGVKQ